MTTDVVIIGAGAAGLTAAYDLIRGGGYAVTILEAHATALGGRLRKMPAGTAGLTDFPIDIGGEWIHKEGPGILDDIIDNPAVVGQWKTFRYLPDFMIYDEEEEAFESDPFFQNENDYHFIGYTWFDFSTITLRRLVNRTSSLAASSRQSTTPLQPQGASRVPMVGPFSPTMSLSRSP
jgi:monoamine oxidase